MPIYLGNSKIQDLYIGGTKIKEAYYGSTLVYSSGPVVNKEVLLYDNNTYTANNNQTMVINTQDSIRVSRRYGVVMYDISATKGSIGYYYIYLNISGASAGQWPSMYGGFGTAVAIPLYSRLDSRTYSAVSGVGVQHNTSNDYYYLNNGSSYWPFANKVCTIKLVIDYNSTSGNVRQYVNDSTHNRTLVGTGSLTGSSTYDMTLRLETSGSLLTMNNIRVAQFDNEADALAYDGEQTV